MHYSVRRGEKHERKWLHYQNKRPNLMIWKEGNLTRAVYRN